MADIKNYKKMEDLGWEVLRKTGDINAYGMIVSSRELAKEKMIQEEQEQSGFGM